MQTAIKIAFALTALVSSALNAGYTQPAPVIVDLAAGVASGDQFSARTAKNDNEFIGCGTRSSDYGDGNPYEFGFCQASDADGVVLVCFTESPTLVTAIRSAASFSYLLFEAQNIVAETDPDTGEITNVGDCTRVGVSANSFYLPKK